MTFLDRTNTVQRTDTCFIVSFHVDLGVLVMYEGKGDDAIPSFFCGPTEQVLLDPHELFIIS